MRKMKFLIVCALLVSIQMLSAQETKHTLIISFSNLEEDEGFVMLKVEDEYQKVVAKFKIPVENQHASASVKLTDGKYGVSAYHDVNGNEELDFNFIGVPTEPYGFGNDARGTFGKPDYSKTLIEVRGDTKTSFKLL